MNPKDLNRDIQAGLDLHVASSLLRGHRLARSLDFHEGEARTIRPVQQEVGRLYVAPAADPVEELALIRRQQSLERGPLPEMRLAAPILLHEGQRASRMEQMDSGEPFLEVHQRLAPGRQSEILVVEQIRILRPPTPGEQIGEDRQDPLRRQPPRWR